MADFGIGRSGASAGRGSFLGRSYAVLEGTCAFHATYYLLRARAQSYRVLFSQAHLLLLGASSGQGTFYRDFYFFFDGVEARAPNRALFTRRPGRCGSLSSREGAKRFFLSSELRLLGLKPGKFGGR